MPLQNRDRILITIRLQHPNSGTLRTSADGADTCQCRHSRHEPMVNEPFREFHMGTTEFIHPRSSFDFSRKLFHDWRMRWKFDSLKMHDRSSVNNWTQMGNKIFGLKRFPRRSAMPGKRTVREQVEEREGEIQQTLVSICYCCLLVLLFALPLLFSLATVTTPYSAVHLTTGYHGLDILYLLLILSFLFSPIIR